MVVQLLTSVDQIGDDRWGQLGDPRLLFETQGWISANESSLAGEPVVTAEVEAGMLRSVMIWRAVDSLESSPYYNIAALLARVTQSAAPVREGWTLNCTGSGMHSPILAAPGVVFDSNRLKAHIEAASSARSTPPAMCGLNFLPRTPVLGLPKALAELNFEEICGYERAVLPLTADTYDGYLSSLPSRKRWNARRDRRQFAESGQSISISTGPSAAGEDLIQLQGYNRSKYKMPHNEQELRKKHDALLRNVGDDGIVFRSHRLNVTTGFVMFFRHRSDLHALFAGFKPSEERTGPYFECLFHAAIEWACRNGIREIDYGIGATTAKAERGCRVDEVSTWYLPPCQRLEFAFSAP